jgi:hypothetical protein
LENFRILKENQTDLVKGKLWDIFELDSFKFEAGITIEIQPKEIFAIVDKFEFVVKISESDLTSELAHYIFQSLGGNKKTPVQEVLAFSYVFFTSPNLRLPEIFKSFTHAIHFNTCLSYFKENSISVPTQYLTSIYELVKSKVTFDAVLSRHIDTAMIKMGDDEYTKWLDELPDKVEDYIKGVNATKNMFKD